MPREAENDIVFLVRKVRFSDWTPTTVAFCVKAASPEAAASNIAMEIEHGGYYSVCRADGSAAHIVRIVPITAYEAVEIRAVAPSPDREKDTP